MKTSQLISLLLFLSAWSVSCFPSKPLNERSTELTWQAWLLIDESQNKQQDSTLRRRITPKSVFIAPTFSPESLPECSEGYQSDSMGRCIKIIMLNKELHLDFLLQQLNQKFGGMVDYEDDEATTSGPVNINIPLNAEIQEETDVAIVVAPTNSFLQNEMQMQLNKNLSEEKVNVGDIAGILGLKQAAEVETTSITGSSTSLTDSTTQESTTKNLETTTLNNGVTSEFNALFFLDPKRQVEVKTDNYDDTTTSVSTTLDVATTETEIMKTTMEIKRETTNKAPQSDTESPLFQMDQALPLYSEPLIPFSDIKREAVKPTDATLDEAQTTDTTLIYSSTTSPGIRVNNMHHQEDPIKRTSMTPIVLTPIDNSLSNQDPSHVTQSSNPSNSVFSNGFHKLDYASLSHNSMALVSRLGEDKNKQNYHGSSNASFTTTENIMTTLNEDDTSTSTVIPTTEIQTTSSKPTETVHTYELSNWSGGTVIKFPTQTSHLVRFPTDITTKSTKPQAIDLYQHLALFNKRAEGSTENQRFTINNQETNPTHVDLSHTLYNRYKAHRDNHRNREKHSEWFHLPPKWSDSSQKPVVLRFSRKHGYIDSQQLGTNNFYREINPRLFGFPVKSRIQR